MMEKEMNRKHLGEQVRKIREEQGWTVDQLAAMCDVKRQTVAKIEEGAFNVPIDIIGKVCDALNVKMVLIEQ